MNIAIGCDHAGVDLKKYIISKVKGHEYIDVGTDSYESCDYPDYVKLVAELVLSGSADCGIALCGTGIGASIAANKFHGIRAALCTNEYMATMARNHNNANVLVLGARIVGVDLAVSIVSAFLLASFEGGRHQRRLDKILEIEKTQ